MANKYNMNVLKIGVMFGLLLFCSFYGCLNKENFMPKYVKEGAKGAMNTTKKAAEKGGKMAAKAAINTAKGIGSIVAVGNAAVNAYKKAADGK